ncbi:MAG TPA: hypothetical protein VLK79_16620 [Gaiellales bacterium]|nr:hypothetical protein [Gaiellales bacterium]
MDTEQPLVFDANGGDAPAVPRRPGRSRAGEPGVQAACRRVLAALDGLGAGEQLRVLRAAALLLGPDDPTA